MVRVTDCICGCPHYWSVLGIGRSTALKYSELGYTVFALCPNHHRGISVVTSVPSSVSSASNTSCVSSCDLRWQQILYSWHLRKERSPDHPWGIIAPIIVDISSKADRLRAYETVKAYCSDHSLHLSALIAFPPIYESPSESTSPNSADTHTQDRFTPKFLPLSFSKDSVWQDSVFREITEPVLIIQEYTRLLKESTGQIIIVSGCSQGRFLCESIHRNQIPSLPANIPTARSGISTLHGARRSIAHSVACELKPFGIKVSSLVSGLLAMPTQRVLDELQVL